MASPAIDEKTTLDLSSLSNDELVAEAMRLAGVLEICNDQRQAIFSLLAKREAQAKTVLEGMSPVEKAVVRDALIAELDPTQKNELVVSLTAPDSAPAVA